MKQYSPGIPGLKAEGPLIRGDVLGTDLGSKPSVFAFASDQLWPKIGDRRPLKRKDIWLIWLQIKMRGFEPMFIVPVQCTYRFISWTIEASELWGLCPLKPKDLRGRVKQELIRWVTGFIHIFHGFCGFCHLVELVVRPACFWIL